MGPVSLYKRMAADTICAGDELRELPDFHTEMEARLRMNW